MTIFRTIHDKKNPYTIINTSIFEGPKLSGLAIGIWFYAFSRPDNWKFYFNDIQNRFTNGRDAIRTALKELEDEGFLHRKPKQNENGKLSGWDWFFFETRKSIEELKEILPNDWNSVGRENRQAEDLPLPIIDSISTIEQENSQMSFEPEVLRLFSLFSKKIKENDPKSKIPDNPEGWYRDIDRMHRLDNRSYAEIESLINFSQEHEFWRCNILSPAKLRKQATQLTLQMQKKPKDEQSDEYWEERKKDVLSHFRTRWPHLFPRVMQTLSKTHFGVLVGENHVPIAFRENGFIEQVESALRKGGHI